MTTLPTFRVFLADETTVDISAKSPTAARDEARERRPGIPIRKVKVLKEQADA